MNDNLIKSNNLTFKFSLKSKKLRNKFMGNFKMFIHVTKIV